MVRVVGLSWLLWATAVSSAPAQPANDPFATRGAADEWAVTLGAGAALRPTFEGSDRYFVSPLPFVSVVWRDTVSLDTSGLNAYRRFGGLQVGGGLTYSLGRRQGSSVFAQGDERLAGLGDVPAALGARGFANYRLGPAILGVTVTKFLMQGNDGLLVDAGVALPWRVSDRLSLLGRVSAVWADASHTQTYFGVTPAQSAASGYPVHQAGAGLKDVGLGVGARYRLAEHWMLSANARVSRLMDDAAGSPFTVADTGVAVFGMVGYRF